MVQVAHWGVVCLFVLLLAAAALLDIVNRRIPNWAVVGLLLTCVLAWVSGVAVASWPSGLAAGLIALGVTYGLYHFGVLGAGDSKLLGAAALFLGLSRLPQLAALTVLAGGLLALGFLLARPRQAMRGLTARGRAQGAGIGIPYGVAIAIGALATALSADGFLPHVAA